MSLILSLETSTPVCSAALFSDDRLLAHIELHQEQAHAGKLAVLIEKLFELSGKSKKDLKAVAISSGPGSYTGLRIGASTAKGICYALGTQLIACNSLEIMVWRVQQVNTIGALLCPMLDARRMEVYCALYDAEGKMMTEVQSKIIDHTSFAELLAGNKILFFGNGAPKCRGTITHANAIFVEDIYPNALDLGRIASVKYQEGLPEDLISFEPFYLKEFEVKKSSKVLL